MDCVQLQVRTNNALREMSRVKERELENHEFSCSMMKIHSS